MPSLQNKVKTSTYLEFIFGKDACRIRNTKILLTSGQSEDFLNFQLTQEKTVFLGTFRSGGGANMCLDENNSSEPASQSLRFGFES